MLCKVVEQVYQCIKTNCTVSGRIFPGRKVLCKVVEQVYQGRKQILQYQAEYLQVEKCYVR